MGGEVPLPQQDFCSLGEIPYTNFYFYRFFVGVEEGGDEIGGGIFHYCNLYLCAHHHLNRLKVSVNKLVFDFHTVFALL